MEKTTYKTTRQELISKIVPQQTRTYRPISHQEVIDLTLNSIVQAGFSLEGESYTSASEGDVATGKYTIKSVGDNEMNLQIAWLNSYNKTKRLTWGIGSIVKICQNGMISADFGAFKKKHQGNIQDYSPKAISEYVKMAADYFTEMQKQRDEMKNIELSDKVRAELVGRMFLEEDFVTSTQLNIIKSQLKNPLFDYKAPNSMWELYQYTTQAMRDIHPSLWMENHMNAHKFFVNESGILVNSENEVVLPVDEYHISPNQIKIEF